MIESNYPEELMEKINKKNKLFDDQLIECAKNNFKKGQEQERKRISNILSKYKDTFCDLCEDDYQKLKQQIEGEK